MCHIVTDFFHLAGFQDLSNIVVCICTSFSLGPNNVPYMNITQGVYFFYIENLGEVHTTSLPNL